MNCNRFIRNIYIILALGIGVASAADNYTQAKAKLTANPSNYSWMNERSTDNLDFVNMVLCVLTNTRAVNTDWVGQGNYVARKQVSLCNKNSNGGSSAGGGANTSAAEYEYYVVNSTLSDDKTNFNVKIWIRPKESDLQKTDSWPPSEIHVQMNVPVTDDGRGISELHYVELPVNQTTGKASTQDFNNYIGYGFLKPTVNGDTVNILMGQKSKNSDILNGSAYQVLNISRTGSDNSVKMTGFTKAIGCDSCNSGQSTEMPYKVAATKTELLRSSQVNGTWGTPMCFDRTDVKYNTWDYALYDSDTLELFNINGTLDIRYTSPNTSVSYHGNYRNNDLWLPDAAATEITTAKTATVKIQNGSTISDGTLKVNDGGLRKVTVYTENLSTINAIPLSVWINGVDTKIMWDSTSEKFVKSLDRSIFDLSQISSWNDLWLYTNGVQYKVSAPRDNSGNRSWASLANTSKLTYRVESKLTASDKTYLSNKTLNCLEGCPLWNGSNIDGSWSYDSAGSLNVQNGKGFQYTYDGTSLKNTSISSATNLAYTTFLGDTQANSSNNWGKSFNSGPLIPDGTGTNEQTLSAMATVSACSNNASKICTWQKQTNLTTYYIWKTGETRWNKDWSLYDSSNQLISLADPVQVKYVCPAGRPCAAGSQLLLSYEGNGRLNGIPNKCVNVYDYSIEISCNAAGAKQWLNKFNLTASSISSDPTVDYVTNPATSKKYYILPKGSMEYYGRKNSGSQNPCTGLTLNDITQTDINVNDYFVQSMTDIGPMPIDLTSPTLIINVTDGVTENTNKN